MHLSKREWVRPGVHGLIGSILLGVVAEWIRAPNSSSDASVQQSVGSNPGRDTNCVPEQDT